MSQLPYYYQIISDQVEKFMQSSWFTALQEQFNTINMDFIQSMTERLNGVLNLTFSGIGSVFGIVGDIVITLMTMPVILYYLLKMEIKSFLRLHVYSRLALNIKLA